MAVNGLKTCPRCSRLFDCTPENITGCQCSGLTFSPAEKAFIGSNFTGCLCRECLLAMQLECRHPEIKGRSECRKPLSPEEI